MTALYCDPHALAEILRERQDGYEFAARGSVAYFSRLLDFGAWLTGIRGECAHGVWMKTLKTAGWSYSVCNRAMKLHRSGVSATELSLEGGKAVLKRLARPRKPTEAGEAEFGAGAKFDPSPEPSPGAGNAPFPEDTGIGSSAKFAGAAAGRDSVSSEPAEFGAGAKFDEPAEAPAQPVKRAWDAVRERLREAVGETAFDAWLAGLGMEARGAGVVLLAPSAFIRDRVRQDHGERIARFLEQELPGVTLEYGLAEAAPGPAPELPLPEGAGPGSGGDINLVPKPDLLDLNKAGDRMASCALFHDLRPSERFFLSIIAYRDGPRMNGWIVTNNELRAIFGRSESTIQRWSKACQRAGLLRVTERPNRPNRYEAFPDGLPYNRQYQLALMRVIDLNREPSGREAAESAAARPWAGVKSDTPGVAEAPGRGVNAATPEGSVHDTRNRMETGEETAPSRRPPSQALAADRRR